MKTNKRARTTLRTMVALAAPPPFKINSCKEAAMIPSKNSLDSFSSYRLIRRNSVITMRIATAKSLVVMMLEESVSPQTTERRQRKAECKRKDRFNGETRSGSRFFHPGELGHIFRIYASWPGKQCARGS